MPKYILTVTLNPAVDKVVVKKFSPGGDLCAPEVFLSAGGKGINVSRALNSFKINNIATGLLGGASGKFIKKELKKEGIESDFYTIGGETRTNLTTIGKGNRARRVLEAGPMVSGDEFKKFKRKFVRLLKNCRLVVFSGSNANGLPDWAYGELIDMAHGRGVKSVLDTKGQPLYWGMKAGPFLIKPNSEEAREIAGQKLTSSWKIEQTIKYFHRLGAQVVVVSLGKRGAVASDGKEILRATAPKIFARNTVGCGDALLAGFIAGHQKHLKFRDCLALAVACGSANALGLKPGSIEQKIVNRFCTITKNHTTTFKFLKI